MPTRESLEAELIEKKGIELAPADVRKLFEAITTAEQKADTAGTVDDGLW